jgi:hypothetical protein
MDEIGNYFDSRSWQDLSLNVRRWLTQGAKCGVEIYGSAQDFAQVDKSFRRLVNTLYLVQNIVSSPRPSPTRPPVKHIWGIMLVSELDPQAYDEDKKVRKGLIKIPKVHFFERKFCEIFDTTQKIKRSLPAPLIHEERHCDHCGLTKTLHV